MPTIVTSPYASHLGDRDPIAVLSETLDLVRRVTTGWSEGDFDRRYAPGKWTARDLLLHLVHIDLVFSVRARLALMSGVTVLQPFDQDPWIAREGGLASGRETLAAFLGVRPVNLAFFESLTPGELAIELNHPERGTINIDWILRTLAGHDRNHTPHLEALAVQAPQR